jgi:antitoxin (DNA-binding transcriptional repressor) of toxin-antitoxin stability system
MTTQTISITEAARNFSDFVNRVAYRRESFFLIRGKKPVAELRPVVSGKRLSELPGLFQRLPDLSLQEMDSMQEDLHAIRSQTRRGLLSSNLD